MGQRLYGFNLGARNVACTVGSPKQVRCIPQGCLSTQQLAPFIKPPESQNHYIYICMYIYIYIYIDRVSLIVTIIAKLIVPGGRSPSATEAAGILPFSVLLSSLVGCCISRLGLAFYRF